MNKNPRIKKKLSLFLLIYFIIFTSCFSIITLSKYVGTSKGDGNTPIAKWEVSVDTSDNASDTLNIIIGKDTKSYKLKIISTSETKAMYSIELSDLPKGLEVSLDDGAFQTVIDNKIVFENVGYINANAVENTVEHTLNFKAPINSELLEENQININVLFKQSSPIVN